LVPSCSLMHPRIKLFVPGPYGSGWVPLRVRNYTYDFSDAIIIDRPGRTRLGRRTHIQAVGSHRQFHKVVWRREQLLPIPVRLRIARFATHEYRRLPPCRPNLVSDCLGRNPSQRTGLFDFTGLNGIITVCMVYCHPEYTALGIGIFKRSVHLIYLKIFSLYLHALPVMSS